MHTTPSLSWQLAEKEGGECNQDGAQSQGSKRQRVPLPHLATGGRGCVLAAAEAEAGHPCGVAVGRCLPQLRQDRRPPSRGRGCGLSFHVPPERLMPRQHSSPITVKNTPMFDKPLLLARLQEKSLPYCCGSTRWSKL